LICIQGDWSNLVDAKIKGRLAAAMSVDATSPYSPLYARAVGMPRPWGVTALFAEYTGTQQPLDVDWSLEKGVRTTASAHRTVADPIAVEEAPLVAAELPPPLDSGAYQTLARSGPAEGRAVQSDHTIIEPPRVVAFTTFWEFAVALNRSDPAAVALAGDGATSDIPIDGVELRRLLGLMWFRAVLARLSRHWRERVLDVLIESATVPDHEVRLGRQTMHLRELSYEQLQQIGSKTMVPDWIRPDLELLITVGRFWGADAMKRVRFVEAPERHEPSMMESLIDRFRS
jgi:hypothetical protein